MRNAFAEEITRLTTVDERVVLLSGDIGNHLFDRLRAAHPERFFNCGVAEANMMGTAAGMALCGLLPVVYTIAPFTTTRCFEQIRVDVAYHAAPVVIVGTGAGLSYAELGPTHHSLEDLSLLRTLPGMQVLAPADGGELKLALRQAVASGRPTYIRIGKKGEPDVHAGEARFEIGRIQPLRRAAVSPRRGTTIALLAAGPIVAEALEAGSRLDATGWSCEVCSVGTIKPLDTRYLDEVAARVDLLVTVEEHGLIGGLGSAVSEWRTDAHITTPLLRLGAPDQFLHEVASQIHARRLFGIDAEGIFAGVIRAIARGAAA
jgi:transketolase